MPRCFSRSERALPASLTARCRWSSSAISWTNIFPRKRPNGRSKPLLHWGRYGEIFSYDSESDKLFLHRLEHAGDSQPDAAASGIMPARPPKPLPEFHRGECFPPAAPSLLRDLPILIAGLALFYGLLTFARYGIGPVNTQAEIQLYPGALPKYAFFSVARIAIAYFLSLAFTLVYGYVAAYNAKAERFMVPLLDILQSIPVLSFLPPVMLAMIALFPHRQLGAELGCIVLILTGQVWNMTFSFYSSLKSIPREMHEAAEIYRLSWWQRLWQMELPYAAIGLIWNSIMSVAGAWFFLMACEMFVLGNRDLRLPGLGSYLQTAANAGDTRSIIWGLGVMVAIIVLMDQLVWRP